MATSLLTRSHKWLIAVALLPVLVVCVVVGIGVAQYGRLVYRTVGWCNSQPPGDSSCVGWSMEYVTRHPELGTFCGDSVGDSIAFDACFEVILYSE